MIKGKIDDFGKNQSWNKIVPVNLNNCIKKEINMAEKNDQAKKVQINTSDEMARGRYSNNMLVTHSPEEFVIDWLLNSPGGTHLVSRIVVSPGHMKRIVAALEGNLKKYESKFGEIKSVESSEQKFH